MNCNYLRIIKIGEHKSLKALDKYNFDNRFSQYEKQFLQILENDNVVAICGDTGTGK